MRVAILLALVLSTAAWAQVPNDPARLIAAQKEAMQALSRMDGVWRGPAWTVLPSGEKHHIQQTERIGSFLDGSLKVIEGRGYGEGDAVTFNAFGIISFDPAKKVYSMRSYAMGHRGDFVFTPTAEGYTWEVPAGPARIRYTATLKDGTLFEVGDRIVPDREPVRFFEMRLTRVGNTDWPAGGPVPPR
jgi:hypothetical protein